MLSFIVSLLLSTTLSAQDYIPFPPDSSSEWRIDKQTWNSYPWETHDYYYCYYFDGDTLIEGDLYQKRYAHGISVYNPPNGYPSITTTFENLYEGAFRTEGVQVYFVAKYSYSSPQLLFDYSLQVGDTVKDCLVSEAGYGFDPLIIASIDSILIGSRYHKRFNINNENFSNITFFIEGIGHDFGMVEPGYMTTDRSSTFLCYAEDGIPVFPEGVSCDLALLPPAVIPDYFAGNPQWRMQLIFGGAMPCLYEYNYVYYLNGTEIIEDKEYVKMYKKGIVEYSWYDPPPVGCEGTDSYEYLQGLFRQEDRKIIMREGNTDVMIYDFDLDVGDTLPSSPILYEENIYVTAIDSIIVGESYRKVFTLSDGFWGTTGQMIEGIGATKGFLDGIPAYFYPEELVCFSLDGAIYYENPETWAPCDMFVGIEESALSSSSFEIFPNPTSGLVTIKAENMKISEISIIVTDITGRNLKNEIWNSDQNTLVKSLDLSAYSPGMYFITLLGNNGEFISSKKILVE